MKKSKRFILLTLIISFSLIFIACGENEGASSGGSGSEGKSEGEVTKLRLGTLAADTEDSSFVHAARDLAEEIEEATEGQVQIDIYPAAQLGGEVEMAEQVQVGSLDMAIITSTTLANFVEELNVIEMPFLLKDREHAFEVLDGEVGEILSDKGEEAGFINLGYWDVGFKNISNSNVPIYNADDLKGLDIRTGESNILIDTYKALGTNPTPIAFPEVYSSIQQGVVDGFEGAYQPFSDINLFEVQDHYSEIGVGYHTSLLTISKDVFNNLDTESQEILKELGAKHTDKQRELSIEIEERVKNNLKDEGLEIVESDQIDRESFQKVVEPVYEKYEGELGELIQLIDDKK